MRRNIKNARRQHPKRRWCNDRMQARRELREIKRTTDALQVSSAFQSNFDDMQRVLPCIPTEERKAIVDHAKRLNGVQGIIEK